MVQNMADRYGEMAQENSNQHSLGDLLNRYRYVGVAVALIGGIALVLVILKDVIFAGGGESTLGLNSFIAIAAVGALIIFAIVVDARSKNRALTERAEKLGDMAKRMYATVDDLNAANEELARARLQADFASQAKSAFLSDFSGEIELSIKAILGDASILRSKLDLNESQIQAVDSIALNGEKLSTIIGGVVEISRIEAGDIDFAPTDFNLATLIGDLRHTYEKRASERRLNFDIDLPAQEYGAVNGDAQLLRDVLVILLNNALEADESGVIHFLTSRHGEHDYAFEVRDGGPGLSAEALAHIFEPFHMHEGARANSVAKLKIAIADKKVAIMGSQLKCESKPGLGCRFSFTVKLSAAG